MEDALGPLDPALSRVRGLISSLELCHHKAGRWLENILEAIATGDSTKGLGNREPGQLHPAEEVWEQAALVLSAWSEGRPVAGSVGPLPVSALLAPLGERTRLKRWQIQRVVEKIRSLLPGGEEYVWLLLGGGEYELAYRSTCPREHRREEELWLATARTFIRDRLDGEGARLSLALAIDMLWPCHWRFLDNLSLILAAIGGQLEPVEPFAACGRNIGPLPERPRLERLCRTLRAFCGASASGQVDEALLTALGEPTPARRWLAGSLEKTIRLQLDPPADVLAQSALSGPAWLNDSPDGA